MASREKRFIEIEIHVHNVDTNTRQLPQRVRLNEGDSLQLTDNAPLPFCLMRLHKDKLVMELKANEPKFNTPQPKVQAAHTQLVQLGGPTTPSQLDNRVSGIHRRERKS